MFRRLLFCALLALTAGLAAPQAWAEGIAHQRAEGLAANTQHAHHYVYYKCAYHDWRLYGCYGCPLAAQSAANYLRQAGYQTWVKCAY